MVIKYDPNSGSIYFQIYQDNRSNLLFIVVGYNARTGSLWFRFEFCNGTYITINKNGYWRVGIQAVGNHTRIV